MTVHSPSLGSRLSILHDDIDHRTDSNQFARAIDVEFFGNQEMNQIVEPGEDRSRVTLAGDSLRKGEKT